MIQTQASVGKAGAPNRCASNRPPIFQVAQRIMYIVRREGVAEDRRRGGWLKLPPMDVLRPIPRD